MVAPPTLPPPRNKPTWRNKNRPMPLLPDYERKLPNLPFYVIAAVFLAAVLVLGYAATNGWN